MNEIVGKNKVFFMFVKNCIFLNLMNQHGNIHVNLESYSDPPPQGPSF